MEQSRTEAAAVTPMTFNQKREGYRQLVSHSLTPFSGTEVTRTSLGPLICPRQGAKAQMIKHSAFLQQKCYRSL